MCKSANRISNALLHFNGGTRERRENNENARMRDLKSLHFCILKKGPSIGHLIRYQTGVDKTMSVKLSKI
jgi:hypothetical protein